MKFVENLGEARDRGRRDDGDKPTPGLTIIPGLTIRIPEIGIKKPQVGRDVPFPDDEQQKKWDEEIRKKIRH